MSAKHEYVRGEERSGTEGTEPIAAIKKREWEKEKKMKGSNERNKRNLVTNLLVVKKIQKLM